MAAIEDRARHPNSVAHLYPFFASARLAVRSLSHAAVSKGSGYLMDPKFGDLVIYLWTPRTFAPQLKAAGLEVVGIVCGRYPEVDALWQTPWHYYACRKPLRA
jgi:hypothetical protein